MFPPIFPNKPYHTLSSLTFTNLKLFTNTVDNNTFKTIDTLPKDTSSIFSSLSFTPIQTASLKSVISLPDNDGIHYVSDWDDSLGPYYTELYANNFCMHPYTL